MPDEAGGHHSDEVRRGQNQDPGEQPTELLHDMLTSRILVPEPDRSLTKSCRPIILKEIAREGQERSGYGGPAGRNDARPGFFHALMARPATGRRVRPRSRAVLFPR